MSEGRVSLRRNEGAVNMVIVMTRSSELANPAPNASGKEGEGRL